MTIKPSRLNKGDTIGLISPSAGLSAIFPHRLDNAIKFLESEGYNIKEFNNTRKISGWESAPAEERAKDIMAAFLDSKVKMILCTIGGDNLNKTLKYLDYDKIKQNPKILCGYSDITVLHYAILSKSDLTTFYGPCALTQFGEFPKPLDYTWDQFQKAICSGEIGEVKPSIEWTDEVLDWSQKKDLERPRKMEQNNYWSWIREGATEGEIVGGCLHSMTHLIGTEYFPDISDKILFIEIPEGDAFDEGESLAEVDAQLADLELAGIFGKIKGLIVGRPFKYNLEAVEDFKRIILDNTKDYNFPILFGADIGHTDPQITIPLGVKVELDSRGDTFKFLETGVN